ncbi:MAG: ATP-binding protein [Phycisphaerae bacterium]
MIPRHLSRALKAAARDFPVVTVTGPRQSGKTTLVRAAFPRHRYASLEDPDVRGFAMEDPRGFLDQFRGKAVLDEIQRTPDLFSYIQGIVDRTDRPGQFVLSGSQNFLLLHRISQTLAGRCAVLRLLPFSRSELVRRPIRNIVESFRTRRTAASTAKQGPARLFETLFAGGYPRIHDKGLKPQKWLGNYYQTYIERDVRDLLNVGDIEGFGRFVRLCAGRSGQLLNASSLAADAGVSHTTVRRWLSILEASFVIHLLRPHHRNFNKRLVKSPKLYFLDTGLLCYLLRVQDAEALVSHAARGAIFETWVVSEALKNFYHRGMEPDIHFWRDSGGHEVDLLIDEGERQIPVEIKSGQTIASDFFDGIHYWRHLAGRPNSAAGLVHGGDASYKRRGVSVLPWSDWA